MTVQIIQQAQTKQDFYLEEDVIYAFIMLISEIKFSQRQACDILDPKHFGVFTLINSK